MKLDPQRRKCLQLRNCQQSQKKRRQIIIRPLFNKNQATPQNNDQTISQQILKKQYQPNLLTTIHERVRTRSQCYLGKIIRLPVEIKQFKTHPKKVIIIKYLTPKITPKITSKTNLRIYRQLWNIKDSYYRKVQATKAIIRIEDEKINDRLNSILYKLRDEFLKNNNLKQSDIYYFLNVEISIYLFGEYIDINDLAGFDMYTWAYFILHGLVDDKGKINFVDGIKQKQRALREFWLQKLSDMHLNEKCQIEEYIYNLRKNYMRVCNIKADQQLKQLELENITEQLDCIIIGD